MCEAGETVRYGDRSKAIYKLPPCTFRCNEGNARCNVMSIERCNYGNK